MNKETMLAEGAKLIREANEVLKNIVDLTKSRQYHEALKLQKVYREEIRPRLQEVCVQIGHQNTFRQF